MVVSHERVRAVVGAMKGDAVRASSLGSQSKYGFETFCRQYGIYGEGAVFHSDHVLISCPFHSDSTPSCHIRGSKWIYNCFGCRGGDFLNFRHRYLTEVLGEEISWYQMLDRMLKEDPVLMNTLGFCSIYVKEAKPLGEIGKISLPKFSGVRKSPDSYLGVADKFLKTDPDISSRKMFILLMQKGIPAKDIWEAVMGREKEVFYGGGDRYDLSKMNQF